MALAGRITEDNYKEVSDGETVWRAVRANCMEIKSIHPMQLSSQAFRCTSRKPSVDRALIQENPEATQFSDSDGVVQLLVKEVRDLGASVTGKGKVEYAVDVLADPLESNGSHAQIVCNPKVQSSAFKRLLECLARLAAESPWVIEPDHGEFEAGQN